MAYTIVYGPDHTRPGDEKVLPELIGPYPSIPIMVQVASELDIADIIEKIIKTKIANQASETDITIAIINRRILITNETDLAQIITTVKIVSTGQAVETGTSQAINVVKSFVVGQTSEVDIAQNISINPQRRLIGQVIETDTAQIVVRGPQIIPIAQVTETNTSQQITVI